MHCNEHLAHFNNLLKILNKNRIFSFKLWGTISMGPHLVKTRSKQKTPHADQAGGVFFYDS